MTQNNQDNLEKEEQSRRTYIARFQDLQLLKQCGIGIKYSQTDQQKSPQIDSYMYGHLDLRQRHKCNSTEERIPSTPVNRAIAQLLKNKKALYPYLTPYTNINSRWVIDLNIKRKSIRLLEENIEEYLCDLRVDKDFLTGHKRHQS